MKLENGCCCNLRICVIIIGISAMLGCVYGIVEESKSYGKRCWNTRKSDDDTSCSSSVTTDAAMSISGLSLGIIVAGLTVYGSEKEIYSLLLGMIILQGVGLSILIIVVLVEVIAVSIVFTFYLGLVYLVLAIGVVALAFFVGVIEYSRCQEIRSRNNTAANDV